MPNIEKNVNIMSRCQIRVPYLFHNLTKRFPLPCIKCLALNGNVLLRRRNRKTVVTGSNPPKQVIFSQNSIWNKYSSQSLMTYNVAILLCTCLWRQLLWASEVCSLWWRLQISQETKMMRHLLHSGYVIHINAKKIACTIRPRENSRGIWFPHYFLEWKYYMYKYH